MQGDYVASRAFIIKSLVIHQGEGNKWGISGCFSYQAYLMIAQGQAERGARMLGAVEAMYENMGAQIFADEQDEYDHNIATASTLLGKEAFAEAWAEGRAMSWEQAIAYALE